MAIVFRSAASANSSSVSITTPTSGDVILVMAYNNASTTIPTLASGYTSVDTQAPGGSSNAARLAWKISDGTETTSGTWTNATQVVVLIYGGVKSSPVGAFLASTGNSASLSYATLTLNVTSGSSWVAGVGAAKGATAGMNGTTTALTSSRTNVTTANGLDTNAGVTSFAAQTLSVTGSGRWITWSVEILQSSTLSAAAGALGFTGASASLYRTLFADSSAFGFTGAAAAMYRSLLASASAFGFTGSDAALYRTLLGAGGALGFSGNPASMYRALLASSAALGFTGADATLWYYKVPLNADSGFLGFTGTGVSFYRSLLASEFGFGFTGADALLSYFKVPLSADSGSLGFAGDDAAMFRTLLASAGSLGFAGDAAALIASRKLFADSGVISFSGVAARLRHIARLQDAISIVKVSDGATGPTGAAGINGKGFILTNWTQGVPSAPDGSSPNLTGANGFVKAFDGGTDVSSSVTIGSVTATGCTGTCNTADNTPVAGQVKGYYQVTAMSADTATLDIPVTYGSLTITLRFSLSKNKSSKNLTVISDRQVIKYDTSGALSPSSQTTTFTANKQNTTATVTWTMTQLDGTALTASLYLSATTGDSVTMTAANFDTARGSQLGVIVIGTLSDGGTFTDKVSMLKVQDGAQGPTGPTGAAGINGKSFALTNQAYTAPSNADGSSPNLTGANGFVKVFDGTSDVTATVTIGSVTATGCTGTCNTADNTPVAGQVKGYYQVTAMSSDSATLDIPVTLGSITQTLRFSLGKSKQGVNAKTLVVTSDRQNIVYDTSGALNPTTQTTTFTANKQNTTATVTWTMTKLDGSALTASLYLSATTGDSVTMSASNFNTARGATEGVIVTGTLTDGVTISDLVSIVRVQGSLDSTTAAGDPPTHSASEETYQDPSRNWQSRALCTITWPSTSLLLEAVEIWVALNGGTSRYVAEIPYPGTAGYTPALPIGTHTFTYYTRTRSKVKSGGVSDSVLIDGVPDSQEEVIEPAFVYDGSAMYIQCKPPQARTNKLKGAAFWSNGGGLSSFTAANVNNGTLTDTAFTFTSAANGLLVFDAGVGNTLDAREVICAANSGASFSIVGIEYSDNATSWTFASQVVGMPYTSWENLCTAAGKSPAQLEWSSGGAHRYWRITFQTGVGTVTISEVELHGYAGTNYPYAQAIRVYSTRNTTPRLLAELTIDPSTTLYAVPADDAYHVSGNALVGGTVFKQAKITTLNYDGAESLGRHTSGFTIFIGGSTGLNTDQVDLDLGGRDLAGRLSGSVQGPYQMGAVSGSCNLHGVYSSAGEYIFICQNTGSFPIVLKHQSATETTSARRLINATGLDTTVAPGGVFTLFDTGSGWRTVVEIPQTTRARATRITSGVSCASGVWTSIPYNGVDFDNGSIHNTVTNPTRFTAPRAGTVQIGASASVTLGVAADIGIRILKNGTSPIAQQLYPSNATSAQGQIIQITWLDKASTGDYYEIQVYQNTGSSMTTGFSVLDSAWFALLP